MLFYLFTLQFVVTLLLYCTKLGSPYSWLKVYFFQTVSIRRLKRLGISKLNWLIIQEMKPSGAIVGLWMGLQARSYIYMKGKPFHSKTLCKIDRVLTLGQSLLTWHFVTSLPHPHGHMHPFHLGFRSKTKLPEIILIISKEILFFL